MNSNNGSNNPANTNGSEPNTDFNPGTTNNQNLNPNAQFTKPSTPTYDGVLNAVKTLLGEAKQAISERRLAANRQNSLKSTGPRTEGGKMRSRMNALKNMATGQKLILRDDEYVDYFDHIARNLEDLRPVGAIEEQIAMEIAEHHNRLNMLCTVQNNMLNLDTMDIMNDYPSNADQHLTEVVGKVESLRNDCSGPKVFDTIGRQEARTTRHLVRLQDMFNTRQDRRLRRSKGEDTFDLSQCRAYQITLAQLQHYQRLEEDRRAAEEGEANEAARRAAEERAAEQQAREAEKDAAKAKAAEAEQNTTTSEMASFDKKPDGPTPAPAPQAAPATQTAASTRKSHRKGAQKRRR